MVDMLLSIKFVFSTTTKKVILTYLYFKLLSSGRIHHFSSKTDRVDYFSFYKHLKHSLFLVFFPGAGFLCK